MIFTNKECWSRKSDSVRYTKKYHQFKRTSFVQSAMVTNIKMVMEIDDRCYHLSMQLSEAKALLAELAESVGKVEAFIKRQEESAKALPIKVQLDDDFIYETK